MKNESQTIEIRHEQPSDIAAIRDVNRRAFGQDQEGDIVDALRSNGAALLSLVATLDGTVVAHIMYSPLSIGALAGAGLGPMAVHPDHQRHGIGSALVRSGSEKLAGTGCPFIAVLGHPSFYPRFGFRPASAFGVSCEWDVPDEVFMLLGLDPPKMRGVSGLARYRPEFSAVA